MSGPSGHCICDQCHVKYISRSAQQEISVVVLQKRSLLGEVLQFQDCLLPVEEFRRVVVFAVFLKLVLPNGL